MNRPRCDAREELAGQRHDRPLRLAVDLLAEEQEVRPRAEREVEQLALERAPAVVGNVTWPPLELSSPRGQVDERQVGRPGRPSGRR